MSTNLTKKRGKSLSTNLQKGESLPAENIYEFRLEIVLTIPGSSSQAAVWFDIEQHVHLLLAVVDGFYRLDALLAFQALQNLVQLG